MANTTTPEMLETRKRAVARYLEGTGTLEVAALHGVTRETVRRWIKMEGETVRRDTPPLTDAELAHARHLIRAGASRSEAARTIGRSPRTLAAHGLAGWTAEQVNAHVALIKSSAYRNLGLSTC